MKGHFLAEPIILSYQTLLEFGIFPKGKTVLGGFFNYSRYAGPREAVFSALCRKNMGCSHFVVGCEDTGVVDSYSDNGYRELFDSLGDIGVKPVYFESVGFNSVTDSYEAYRGQALRTLSETEVCKALREERHLPDCFMRDLVQEVLQDMMRTGNRMFHE
jgi:ATP sulfurylase